MELILTLAMKFWQWTILIVVVIIGAIINFTDKRKKPNLKFNFKGFPELKPLAIICVPTSISILLFSISLRMLKFFFLLLKKSLENIFIFFLEIYFLILQRFFQLQVHTFETHMIDLYFYTFFLLLF